MRQPSKYLFFGSQPDGPESTRVRAAWLCGVVCVTIPWQWPLTLLCVGGMRRARFRRVFVLVLVCACACACARACAWVQPATGKRSERVRRFKKSREPSLAQVDAERKAAIQRCKLEPLDTTHGVNSALRVVLSSPDLRSKRQVRASRLAWRLRSASHGSGCQYPPLFTRRCACRLHLPSSGTNTRHLGTRPCAVEPLLRSARKPCLAGLGGGRMGRRWRHRVAVSALNGHLRPSALVLGRTMASRLAAGTATIAPPAVSGVRGWTRKATHCRRRCTSQGPSDCTPPMSSTCLCVCVAVCVCVCGAVCGGVAKRVAWWLMCGWVVACVAVWSCGCYYVAAAVWLCGCVSL